MKCFETSPSRIARSKCPNTNISYQMSFTSEIPRKEVSGAFGFKGPAGVLAKYGGVFLKRRDQLNIKHFPCVSNFVNSFMFLFLCKRGATKSPRGRYRTGGLLRAPTSSKGRRIIGHRLLVIPSSRAHFENAGKICWRGLGRTAHR